MKKSYKTTGDDSPTQLLYKQKIYDCFAAFLGLVSIYLEITEVQILLKKHLYYLKIV